MALALEPAKNRRTAILILVVVILLVYFLGFHWFIAQHLEYGTEVSELAEQLDRFQRVASQREVIEKQLQSLQGRRAESNLFLEEGDFNEAAAAMSERLNQMVSGQADESCQIVSRQPVRAREVERFEKVTVNVRMRCNVDDLTSVLYSLETGVPMFFIEELTILKPRARRKTGDQEGMVEQALDVRFNMSGYLH